MSIRLDREEYELLRAVVQAGADGVPVRRAERVEQAVMSATPAGDGFELDLEEASLAEVREAFLSGEAAFPDEEGVTRLAEILDVRIPGLSP